jgi:hypothetical protein
VLAIRFIRAIFRAELAHETLRGHPKIHDAPEHERTFGNKSCRLFSWTRCCAGNEKSSAVLEFEVACACTDAARRLAPETIALIEPMVRENRLWGAERIRDELPRLNIKMAIRTIQKYIQAARSLSPSGQSWSTFLKTHGEGHLGCDFVPVVTLFFKTLHAFVIVHPASQRMARVGVTDHLTDEWITQPVRDMTPFEEKSKYLICDNDKKYGSVFERVAKASGSGVIHTPPYQAPRANFLCERFAGSLREANLGEVMAFPALNGLMCGCGLNGADWPPSAGLAIC